VTRRVRPMLIRRIREFDYEHFRRSFSDNIDSFLSLSNRNRILIRVYEDPQSIALTTLTVNILKPRRVTAFYFPRGRGYRIPSALKRLMNDLGITISTIDINMIVSNVKGFLKGFLDIKDDELFEDIVGLVLRSYADQKKYLVIGEYTRTTWLLGGFHLGYARSIDYLPLYGVYYSQIKYIVRELKVYPVIHKIGRNGFISNIMKRFELGDEETLDAIIYGIENGYSDDEISDDLGLKKDTVHKIRNIVNINYIKRNRPLLEI